MMVIIPNEESALFGFPCGRVSRCGPVRRVPLRCREVRRIREPFRYSNTDIPARSIFELGSLLTDLPAIEQRSKCHCPKRAKHEWNVSSLEDVSFEVTMPGETSAVVRIPSGVNPENLTIDLDEKRRRMTVSVRRQEKSSFMAWSSSVSIPKQIDLANLQASFDSEKNELRLTAPLQEPITCITKEPQESIDDSQSSGYTSEEEERPPSVHSKSRESSRKDVEIEDVGPEEEIDRISISSSDS